MLIYWFQAAIRFRNYLSHGTGKETQAGHLEPVPSADHLWRVA
jgi:hypothetical protein